MQNTVDTTDELSRFLFGDLKTLSGLFWSWSIPLGILNFCPTCFLYCVMYFKLSAKNMNKVTVLPIKGFEIALHSLYRHYFDVFTDAFSYIIIRNFFFFNLPTCKSDIAAHTC